MHSKRFIKNARKFGSKNLPDWMIIAYWILCMRNYKNHPFFCDPEIAKFKNKFMGD